MPNGTINAYKDEIVRQEVRNLKELEEFRLKWLSKKGVLAELFSQMKEVPAGERKNYGQEVNTLKQLVEERFAVLAEQFQGAKEKSNKGDIDLSLDGSSLEIGSRHPLTIM